MNKPVAVLLSSIALVTLASGACTPPGGAAGGTPSATDSAAVDKVVRDLYTGYTTAATGDQARASLETNGTAAFIDGLKAKAAACTKSSSAGTPDATCDQDPIVCTTAPKPALTAVVPQTAGGGNATATAVVTPEGAAPINVKVGLAGANGAFKVSSVDCPK